MLCSHNDGCICRHHTFSGEMKAESHLLPIPTVLLAWTRKWKLLYTPMTSSLIYCPKWCHITLSGAQVSWERQLSCQVLGQSIKATISWNESNHEAPNCLVTQYKPEKVPTPPALFFPTDWYSYTTGEHGGISTELGCLTPEGALSKRFLQFYGPVGRKEYKEKDQERKSTELEGKKCLQVSLMRRPSNGGP